ncbi:hypothetical protein [Hyalangium rubrum]|uniref:Lipoprotein n=1 Tax=Hyalangium rubrum TaxID=3103134 RepID=A0ABU5H4V8_9BACT|nr:hypothetical protein [Hyalangium sp. s54d21]MDY7228498.1 hypothetical protein [Hyalangium sp. s54d21]
MRSLRTLWWLAALCLSGCSLLLDFDPEGQPCDSQNRCLEGYTCQAQVCVSSPGADGGTGANACDTPEGCPEQPPAEAR